MALPPQNNGLCIVDEVKQESAGRITDNTLDSDIQYKITDLSEKLLEKYPSLTSKNRTARKCCIYGVLAWLILNKKIKENKKISSFKDGNFSANYTNTSTEEDNDSVECKTYKKLLRQLMPAPPAGAMARGRHP
jgi:asparagine synthetase A